MFKASSDSLNDAESIGDADASNTNPSEGRPFRISMDSVVTPPSGTETEVGPLTPIVTVNIM